MTKLFPDRGWKTLSCKPKEVRCKESLEEYIVVARAIVLPKRDKRKRRSEEGRPISQSLNGGEMSTNFVNCSSCVLQLQVVKMGRGKQGLTLFCNLSSITSEG